MDETTQQPSGPRVSVEQMRDLGRLRRHGTNRHVAGVAGGLGRHLDVDPVILRVAFVVLTFFGGAGLLLYGAAWLFVPEDGTERAVVDLDPRTRTWALAAAGLIGVLITVGDSWGLWALPWPLLLIAVVAVLVGRQRDQRAAPPVPGPDPAAAPFPGPSAAGESHGFVPGPAGPAPAPREASPAGRPTAEPVSAAHQWYAQQPYAQRAAAQQPYAAPAPPPWVTAPAPTPPPRAKRRGPLLFWIALPLLALALGTLGIVDAAGATVSSAAYPALALGVIGTMLVIGAWWGRAGGLIALGLIAALALSGDMIADRFVAERLLATPTTTELVEQRYHLPAGEIVVDLSEVSDPEELAGRQIEVRADAGRVEVIVPEGIDVTVDGRVDGPGAVTVFGSRTGGGIDLALERTIDEDPELAELELTASVAVGEVVVRHP